ncbi:MAG: type II secretion system F family protein [Vulcanimicrobiota bacterium]
MAQFAFNALDKDKRSHVGILDASDRDTAMTNLSEKYEFVLELREIKEKKGFFSRRITGEDLMLTTKQLATLLRSGISLVRAIEIIAADTENHNLQAVLAKVESGISEGKPLSDMLAKYPDIFTRLYVYMVKAGETSGSLAEILSKLAVYMEKAEELRRKVIASLYYPIAVIIIAFLMVVFIFIFGVNQFQQIYSGLGSQLPAATRVLIAIKESLINYWYIIVIVLFAISYAAKLYFKTGKGENLKDTVMLHLPVFGPLFQRLAIARFARTLATLYSGGVPIVQALELVAGSIGNRMMEKVVLKAVNKVKEGESITGPLRDSGVFTIMAISMMASGEESGTMDIMLVEISEFYESQVDVMLRALVGLLEPVVILVVGVIVGFLIFALGMPLFNLVQSLG